MACDVRQALLRDAEDRQLLLARECRQAGCKKWSDAKPGSVGHLRSQRDQRAAQPELVESLRAQAARDLAHVLHAGPSALLYLHDRLLKCRRRRALESLQLQHDAGKGLADLVVQLAREPSTFALLGRQCAAAARAPLVLEAIEHRVERVTQVRDLGVCPREREAPARCVRIDPAHQCGQLLERTEHAPKQQQVHRDHQHGPDREHDRLGDLQARAHGRG